MRARIFNETRGVELAGDAEVADRFASRLVGLMGRRDLPRGAGLVIVPCSSVHGVFMRFAIDVLFLDREDRVLHAMRLPRNGFSPLVRRARRAIELPQGTIQETKTAPGDIVRVVPIAR
jgi:hypothetical protein